MSTTQFNPDADPLESFIQHFEAAGMKSRLQAMRLILADHFVEPGLMPLRPAGITPEQDDRLRHAVLEAKEWERAYIKALIRHERQARKQAETTQKA